METSNRHKRHMCIMVFPLDVWLLQAFNCTYRISATCHLDESTPIISITTREGRDKVLLRQYVISLSLAMIDTLVPIIDISHLQKRLTVPTSLLMTGFVLLLFYPSFKLFWLQNCFLAVWPFASLWSFHIGMMAHMDEFQSVWDTEAYIVSTMQ